MKVFLASINEVLLNVKICIVKVFLLMVNHIGFVLDKVVSFDEDFLVFVVDVLGELAVTVGLLLHGVDVPSLMHAVVNHPQGETSATEANAEHRDQQWVVRLRDQVGTGRDTVLGKCCTRHDLEVAIGICTRLTVTLDRNDHLLSNIFCIVEHIVASIVKGVSEHTSASISLCSLTVHLQCQSYEGSLIERRICVQNTVLHVFWVVFWGFN